MSESSSPEAAVRRYLAWIDDPSSAVDENAVQRADTALAEASDPIDRLHAAAARERAKAADVDAIRAGFVANARSYADAEGIPVEAFRVLGVEDAVLVEAGFDVPLTQSGRQRRRRSGQGRARSPQVSVAQVKAVSVDMPKRFTLSQLAERAGGGSPVTIRKAVDELIEEGLAIKVGPSENHAGPGRAPTVYELR
ncbi:MAG: hypothetical protein ABI239_08490 [Aquihabitans sp.]